MRPACAGRWAAIWLTALLSGWWSGQARAQRAAPRAAYEAHADAAASSGGTAADALPDAPEAQSTTAPGISASSISASSISGTAMDGNGAEIAGAEVVLSAADDASLDRKATTDASGFFHFNDLPPETYQLTITSIGFATWVSKEIVLRAAESYEAPKISLRVALATTDVDVSFTRYDLAQEQLKTEEQQRVLGIFPNFYVTYVPQAQPLKAGQKFRLAFRTVIDPGSFVGVFFQAGVEQAVNAFPSYGQGATGFFVRSAAAFGDNFNSILISDAILPSLLHQDPRYFYRGTGSNRSRAAYALSAVFLCKGDNGRWQPNYSNVLGNFAAGGISNAYYPAADRGFGLTVENTLFGFAGNAVGNLFQEFVIKKISTGVGP